MNLGLFGLFIVCVLKSASAMSLPGSPILPDSQERLQARLRELFQGWLTSGELSAEPVLELCDEFMARIIVLDSDLSPLYMFENPDALRFVSVQKTEHNLLEIRMEN